MKFIRNENLRSGLIRGEQIMNRALTRMPEMLSEDDDTVLFVKTFDYLESLRYKRRFIDVIDCSFFFYENLNVEYIVVTEEAAKYARRRTARPVHIIPHHHCNFENLERDSSREVKTVGWYASDDRFQLDSKLMTSKLEAAGFEVIAECANSVERAEALKFYSSIDIHIVFCPRSNKIFFPMELKGPLKVINAGSFGIPTVGYQEFAYKRFSMMHALDMNSIVDACLALREREVLYKYYAKASFKEAEPYHIDNILPKYKELIGESMMVTNLV